MQNITVLQPLIEWQQIESIINHYSCKEKRKTAINVLKKYIMFGMIILYLVSPKMTHFMLTAAVLGKCTSLQYWDEIIHPSRKVNHRRYYLEQKEISHVVRDKSFSWPVVKVQQPNKISEDDTRWAFFCSLCPSNKDNTNKV